MNTKIWIDADSCPSLVRNHVVKTGNKLNIPVILVANKEIKCDDNLVFEMIIVEQTKDSADNYILENSTSEDLIITRDIVFADKIVSKGIACINDRGTEFTSMNIKELLSERDYDLALAEMGLVKHFHEGYDKSKFIKFANCFDRVLHRII